MVHVTKSVVRPCLSNIQVLDKRARVSSPELLSWDKSTWWDNWASSDLCSIFYSSSFEDNALVSNDNIVSNVAWVEGAVRPDSGISSHIKLGLHSSWERGGSVKNAILSNAGELADLNTIDITSDHCVVPDGGESLELNLPYHGSGWSNPVIFGSWGNIIQIKLHLMLWILFDSSYLSYRIDYTQNNYLHENERAIAFEVMRRWTLFANIFIN